MENAVERIDNGLLNCRLLVQHESPKFTMSKCILLVKLIQRENMFNGVGMHAASHTFCFFCFCSFLSSFKVVVSCNLGIDRYFEVLQSHFQGGQPPYLYATPIKIPQKLQLYHFIMCSNLNWIKYNFYISKQEQNHVKVNTCVLIKYIRFNLNISLHHFLLH